MPDIRYQIHSVSAQAWIAYAKSDNADPDRYHYRLNQRETESKTVRQGETYQRGGVDSAHFFQTICAARGNGHKHSVYGSALNGLCDVIFCVDFKGISSE